MKTVQAMWKWNQSSYGTYLTNTTLKDHIAVSIQFKNSLHWGYTVYSSSGREGEVRKEPWKVWRNCITCTTLSLRKYILSVSDENCKVQVHMLLLAGPY